MLELAQLKRHAGTRLAQEVVWAIVPGKECQEKVFHSQEAMGV